MQTLSAGSGIYPRNLSFCVSTISNYARNTYKLQSLNMNSASNGQIVTVDLPNNSIVDLSSFTMFFTGSTTTTAGSVVFSRNIETIIDRQL